MNESSENAEQKSAGRVLTTSAVVLASTIAIAAGLVTFASRHLFVAELLNNFRLQIGIAIIGLGFISLVAGRQKLGVVNVLVAAAVLYPVFASSFVSQRSTPGRKIISLLSYNILGDNPDKQPVVDLLTATEADITVVIEYTSGWERELQPLRETNLYSLEVPRWHGFGIGIFSRYRLENEKIESLSQNETDIPFVLAETVIGGQRLIIAAGHFLAPMNPRWMSLRNQQIQNASRLLKEYRNGRDLPVIFVGDMNAVAWSPFIQDLMASNDLRDSRQGYLYQASWPNDNLLLRIPIDHALVSRQIHVHRRRLLDCYSSDHLPLLLEFSVRESVTDKLSCSIRSAGRTSEP